MYSFHVEAVWYNEAFVDRLNMVTDTGSTYQSCTLVDIISINWRCGFLTYVHCIIVISFQYYFLAADLNKGSAKIALHET